MQQMTEKEFKKHLPKQVVKGIKIYVKNSKTRKNIKPRCELCKFAEPDDNLEYLYCKHKLIDNPLLPNGVRVEDDNCCGFFDLSKRMMKDLADGLIE